jgi:hypothetical protein
MITVQQVFDMAIHLMDEQNEQNGHTRHADTDEYRYRTISILNSVIPALYPYSGNYKSGSTGRPRSPLLYTEDYENPDFEQGIPLDDDLSAALLPYYLAGQLTAVENDALSSFFMARYREVFYDIRNKLPASFEPISTPYGLF